MRDNQYGSEKTDDEHGDSHTRQHGSLERNIDDDATRRLQLVELDREEQCVTC